MLHSLATWFLLATLAILVTLGVLFGVFFTQLRRRNRVDPAVETLAPLLWLWSPTQAARFHRRLQVAATPLARVDELEHGPVKTPVRKKRREQPDAPPTGSAADLRRTVREQAVELDRQIVFAARQPRQIRRQAMPALGRQINDLQVLSRRLLAHQQQTGRTSVTLIGTAAGPPSTSAVLADVAEQLDVLEQAHQEVRAIEQANGLLDPELILRQTSGPPQGAPLPAPGPPPAVAAGSPAVPPPTRGPIPGTGPVPGPPPTGATPDEPARPAPAAAPPRATPQPG